jgi:hypothetical protein
MFEQEEAMARAHTFQVDSGSVLATWLVHFSKQSTFTINPLSENSALRKYSLCKYLYIRIKKNMERFWICYKVSSVLK